MMCRGYIYIYFSCVVDAYPSWRFSSPFCNLYPYGRKFLPLSLSHDNFVAFIAIWGSLYLRTFTTFVLKKWHHVLPNTTLNTVGCIKCVTMCAW